MADPREQTNRLLEMIDDGQLDPMMAVTMCVKWMSEDDVAEMMDANELSERFEEDDEDVDVRRRRLGGVRGVPRIGGDA